jgi:CARDB
MRIPIALSLALSTMAPRLSGAQDVFTGWEYAAKAVCGRTSGRIVAPGTYFTAVNVHNPNSGIVEVRFKVATAPEMKPGQIYWYEGAMKLSPDQAFEVDCPEIMKIGRATEFLKGFLVLRSSLELDVVAVYTVAGASKAVEDLEIERVPGRRSGCTGPDLIVESIADPVFDQATKESVITVVIRNVGNAPAAANLARLIDPSTNDPNGAPYNAVQPTPALAPGAAATLTFRLPYWVFNPDADLEVTADYKNVVPECREDNNVRTYHKAG